MQRRTYGSDEGWLLSYADLITNLLIFFVMLLAAAQISRTRMQQIAQGLSGIEQPASLASIQEEIEARIQEKGLQEMIRTDLTDEGLKLSLNSGLVFDSGSAVIHNGQEPVLDSMLQTLVPYTAQYGFAVEGHTDSTPYGNGGGERSNWELSTDRANAVRARMEFVGVERERIRVEGYADTVPLPEASLVGLTPDERLARHRRVVVRILLMGLLPLLVALSASASAQAVPVHPIPPVVLAELRTLESRFELALAADCDTGRCFSKGCAYVEHAVADQPRRGSLPGLGLDLGPGGVEPQEFLTRAQCAFAHEEALKTEDIQALVRRLQTKLSGGFVVVGVNNQPLLPLPRYLREAPEVEPAVAEEAPSAAAPALPPWSAALAWRELWSSLLPHFFWMIGVGLVTAAGIALIWSWRRVGRDSLEEQALLAQIAREDAAPEPPGAATEVQVADTDPGFVARQTAAWGERLQALTGQDHPDPELRDAIRSLLLAGDMPLLAKAVLRFPDRFPAAFPSGGDVATAKLALADFLTTVDADALPSDAEFFEALNRHALSAALASQSDARMVRGLREDFGAAGLATLVGELSPRAGGLLFALSPPEQQHEVTRLLSAEQAEALAGQLLRSDRMARDEAAYLFEVLRAARGDGAAPPAPPAGAALDRGSTVDAAGALSTLLPRVGPERRAALFAQALQRFGGALPQWHRGVFTADMLAALSEESRADLLLEVDAEPLAAWISLLDDGTRGWLLDGMPAALRATVGAAAFPSRARQLALAGRGRQALARGFQRQLARAGLSFEAAVQPRQAGVA